MKMVAALKRAWDSLSLRQLLQLVFFAAMTGFLLTYGSSTYLLNRWAMHRWITHLLHQVAEDVVRAAQMPAPLEPTPRVIPVPSGFHVQIWYVWPDNYQLIARSPDAPAESLDPELRARPPDYEKVRFLEWRDRWWAVLTRRYPAPHERLWIVQVAVDMTPWKDVLAWVGLGLVGMGLFFVLFFTLGLDRVLRWVLWPVEQISALAHSIVEEQDLSRRIPIPPRSSRELYTWARAFNATLDRLEDLFLQQRRFLADVSHELRTPLTIIQGQAQLIRRTGECDPEAVADIEREAERLARLVEDLLFLARAEVGALPLRREPVDLDVVLMKVARQARLLAQAKRQRLIIEHVEPLPVQGDPDRLTQAVLNLVSNAIQYTPEEGRITLGARREGAWAKLWVRDTGPGIPPEDLPHIFERFYRADRSRQRTGFGLGLSIVRWIAELHQGKVTVDSTLGQGTTFTLWLPLDAERVIDVHAGEDGEHSSE